MRLFVAVYPPIELARAWLSRVGAMGGSAAALPEHRASPEAQVHLTLRFIGERREQELDEVVESVQRSASGIGVFTLTGLGLITLPRRGPARLIAIETDTPPPLLELHRRLAVRLARKARKDGGDRFTPHVTLARLREESRGYRLAVPLEGEEERRGFEVREIALMRSVLHATGAEHREVVRVGV